MIDYVRALEFKSSYDRGERILAELTTMGIKPSIQTCRWLRLRNIVVDFNPDSPAKRLLFSAHYDVVKGSPGANDNASGVAVLLGLCRKLQYMSEPVRVVFFDREENWLRTPWLRLGLLGSLYYVYRTDLRNILAVYNLDFCGIGDFLGIWPVKGNEAHVAAVKRVETAASRLGMPFRSAYIPWQLLSSDHLSFRLKGLPNALTLSLLPVNQVPLVEKLLESIKPVRLLAGWRRLLPEPINRVHSQDDTSSYVNENSLQLMLSLLLQLIRDEDGIHS